MTPFAGLLDGLIFAPARNAKLRLLADYYRRAPDPDRGYALAALTGELAFKSAKPALIRGLVAERVDPRLFELSYDYVGDLAETVALIWPGSGDQGQPIRLADVVDALTGASRTEVPTLLSGWLDRLDPAGRWALLKLITGGLRVGVSARLAKIALAEFGDKPIEEIEELWHGLEPPYTDLFAWMDGRAPRPVIDDRATFRPLMLASPIEDGDFENLDPDDFIAEWKWDGARVQAAAKDGKRRLYSRSGDEIGAAFPDVVDALNFDAVVDGELLIARGGDLDADPAPFNHLQQRLNRKTVGKKMLAELPAFVRAYDLLFEDGEDLRALPFRERRRRLEDWYRRTSPERIDLSSTISFSTWSDLAALRDGSRARGIEGLMLKRGDSPYLQGRPKGHWYKWKRGALTLDCVLMYAQRGHGKRSSFYSDYTFGVWRDADLVPVGKAYFGFTDAELRDLDAWVRNNTTDRFGPVRQVAVGLVLEIAFDSVHRSKRHKSGVAMRFPRVHRIRWDKPPAEADRLETVDALVEE